MNVQAKNSLKQCLEHSNMDRCGGQGGWSNLCHENMTDPPLPRQKMAD